MPVMPSSATPVAASTSAGSVAAAAIPALTDQQKKILQEFKQKMALQPPDQQNAYMTANKAALFRQLNLQPSQLEQIKNNHLQARAGVLQQTPPAASAPLLSNAPQQFRASASAGIPDATLTDSVGQKRPHSGGDTPKSSGLPLAKQKRIVWVESQIKKDQNEAVNPNYNAAFKGPEDACKRLLRYHVFDELDTSPEEMDKAEDLFEQKSAALLAKKDAMIRKYHYLLAIESTRPNASSEEVMLARLWDTDERQALAKEKDDFVNGRPMVDLPPLPPKLAEKLGVDPNIGQDMQPAAAPEPEPQEPPSIKEEETKVEEDESKGHVGMKFARSQSGRWGVETPAKADDEYNELEAVKNELNGFQAKAELGEPEPGPSEPERAFGSDNDADEFNLQDVDPAEAVNSIIADMGTDGSRAPGHDNDASETDADAGVSAAESSAMQSAINSIILGGDQDRVETPDFDGLLESIEEEDRLLGERDPITEAAVNNIPRF